MPPALEEHTIRRRSSMRGLRGVGPMRGSFASAERQLTQLPIISRRLVATVDAFCLSGAETRQDRRRHGMAGSD